MENPSSGNGSLSGSAYGDAYALTATANKIGFASDLYGDFYYLSKNQLDGDNNYASIGAAQAMAGSPDATFDSSLFWGTSYSGTDASEPYQFLGSDGDQLNSLDNPIDTSYIDLKGYINVLSQQAGPATFNLSSDDMAIMTIDGLQVMETDNNDTPTGNLATTTFNLSAGTHTIEIQYVNIYDNPSGLGGAELSVSGTFADNNSDPITPLHSHPRRRQPPKVRDSTDVTGLFDRNLLPDKQERH